jgi:hypothetical protein
LLFIALHFFLASGIIFLFFVEEHPSAFPLLWVRGSARDKLTSTDVKRLGKMPV